MSSHESELAQSLSDLSTFLSRPSLEKVLEEKSSASDREQCARWQERLKTPHQLHILIKGNKRAGKSTLLNALFHADYLPANVHPECTALPVSIHKADAFRLEIVGKPVPKEALLAALPKDAQVTEAAGRLTIRRALAPADPIWISQLIKQLGTAQASANILDLLQAEHELRIWLPALPVDDKVVFIDTPGTDGNDSKRELASNRQYGLASAFILAINWKSTPGPEFYRNIRIALGQRLERPILAILTQSDLARTTEDKEGLDSARREVRLMLEQNGFNDIGFVEVSAKNARMFQKLNNNQITIDQILNDDGYDPFSKSETRSLGYDVQKWAAALLGSGNLNEVLLWINSQRSKPRNLGWIAQESANIARSVAYRLESHINIEKDKRTIEKLKLDDNILRANQQLSNQLRSLDTRKEEIVSEFQKNIGVIDSKIGTDYYPEMKKQYLFSQIVSFCQKPEEQEKLKEKNTRDAEREINRLIGEYINSENEAIKKDFNYCIEQLRREIFQLTKEAWEKIFVSATDQKVSPGEPSGGHVGKIVGFFVGGGIAAVGVLMLLPLVPVGAAVFGLGWWLDSRLNPGDEYAASAIKKTTDVLIEQTKLIRKQLKQAEIENIKEANEYFATQTKKIMQEQDALDKQLKAPAAAPEELLEHERNLIVARDLTKRLSEISTPPSA